MPETLEEKVSDYQQELAKTVKELNAKRNELDELSRVTVQELNPMIPKLQEEIKIKKAELAELEKIIYAKGVESIKEGENYAKKYYDLEAKLMQETARREAKIDERQIALDKLNKELSAKEADLKTREDVLKSARSKLSEDQKILSDGRKQLAEDQRISSSNFDKIRQEIDDANALILEAKEALKVKEYGLNLREESVSNREKGLETLAVRYADIEAKEAAFKASLEELKTKEERLNQMNVSVKVNIQRSKDLDAREKSLNEREANVKLLEAKIQ